MKLLFDTHSFIWWDSDPARLPQSVLNLCQDVNNSLVLSVVSVWEIQIKSQLGKLTLHSPLAELIEGQQLSNFVELLPVHVAHVYHLNSLPLYHNDPFDRLLIAQARLEGAVLLSKDRIFSQYPVECYW